MCQHDDGEGGDEGRAGQGGELREAFLVEEYDDRYGHARGVNANRHRPIQLAKHPLKLDGSGCGGGAIGGGVNQLVDLFGGKAKQVSILQYFGKGEVKLKSSL